MAQLRAFLAVATGGSVREAARQLVVTESAVSSAVGALNRQLGLALLERHGRGVRCSAAGLAFAPYARRVLGLLEEGRLAATGGADPEVGTVRIAAVTTAAEQVLPTLLVGFRTEHPDVTLHLQVSDNRTLWAAFDACEADVVLAGRPAASVDGAVTRATRANRLIAVAAPAVRVDAARTAWLMREPGSGIRAALEALLVSRELDPPLLYMGSSGAVTAGAMAGLGIALVSEDAVRTLLVERALRVVELPELPLVRPWHLVTRAVPTATTQLFVEHLMAAPRGGFSVARSPVPVPTR